MPSIWIQRAPVTCRAPDDAELTRGLQVLLAPGMHHEIIGLCKTADGSATGGPFALAMGGDPGALARAADVCDQSTFAVYYTINPVLPALQGKAARDSDVLSRYWFLADVDPVRPKGLGGESATEVEGAAARDLAGVVVDFLGGLGFPDPVVVDSGNGYQLLYRLSLAADALSRVLIRDILRGLAHRFDTPAATIDAKTFNAARLAALPGTWKRKGTATPERPHRVVKILSVPDSPQVVTPVILARAAEALAVPEEPKRKGPAGQVAGQVAPAPRVVPDLPPSIWKVIAAKEGKQKERYARRALDLECADLAATPEGGRNDRLNRAAYLMGTLIAAGVLPRADAEKELTAAGLACGLPPGEVDRHITRGIEDGLKAPRVLPSDMPGLPPGPGAGKVLDILAQVLGKAGNGTTQHDDKVTIGAHEIESVPVRWLWPGVIPRGKLTTLAGSGGLGKSFVTCAVAAIVSNGDPWPFADGECSERCGVLIVNSEDAPNDTLVPRLIEQGADRGLIRFMRPGTLGTFKLSDLETLHKAIEETPDCGLIVIDPAPSHVGAIDDNNNIALRGVLTPLSLYVEALGLACLLVTHVGKGRAHTLDAAAKVLGSVAWVNAVRSVLVVCKDKDNPGDRLIVSVKQNLAPEPRAVAYRIEKTETLARVVWVCLRDVDPDEAVAPPLPPPRESANGNGNHRAPRNAALVKKGVEFLRDFLDTGPRLGEDCMAEGNKSIGTDMRLRWWLDTILKDHLQGFAKKRGFGSDGQWFWDCPRSANPADTVRPF